MKTFLKILSEFQLLILVSVILIWLRKELRSVVKSLAWRLRSGASFKLASMEFSAVYVQPNAKFEPKSSTVQSRTDQKNSRLNERIKYYEPNRGIMLVHRIAPSDHEGQLYDILIYLTPHKDSSLVSVSKVEYYFGEYWKNQVFTVTDRARNFPIATSAYGPFVCTAELFFSDGTKCMLSRYIDFEMGAVGDGSSQSAA